MQPLQNPPLCSSTLYCTYLSSLLVLYYVSFPGFLIIYLVSRHWIFCPRCSFSLPRSPSYYTLSLICFLAYTVLGLLSTVHCKKRFAIFPSPARMSLIKLSWLGTGKSLTFFLQCIITRLWPTVYIVSVTDLFSFSSVTALGAWCPHCHCSWCCREVPIATGIGAGSPNCHCSWCWRSPLSLLLVLEIPIVPALGAGGLDCQCRLVFRYIIVFLCSNFTTCCHWSLGLASWSLVYDPVAVPCIYSLTYLTNIWSSLYCYLMSLILCSLHGFIT
jgi:hypothetical protein